MLRAIFRCLSVALTAHGWRIRTSRLRPPCVNCVRLGSPAPLYPPAYPSLITCLNSTLVHEPASHEVNAALGLLAASGPKQQGYNILPEEWYPIGRGQWS